MKLLKDVLAAGLDTLTLWSLVSRIVLLVSICVLTVSVIFGGFWAHLAGVAGLCTTIVLLLDRGK